MTQHGTVVNGVIVLDSPVLLPEGTRVRVELDAEAVREPRENTPPERETYAEHLDKLRQSIAAVDAGEQGMPAEWALEMICRELEAQSGDRS